MMTQTVNMFSRLQNGDVYLAEMWCNISCASRLLGYTCERSARMF